MSLSFFYDFYAKSPVTFVLSIVVLICTGIPLINKKLLLAFILHPQSVVRQRQYYRIFTADLVNADILHLALNEFMLYVFCSDLEETLRKHGPSGSLQFAMIYWGSVLFASVIVIIRHFREFSYSTTGTSGSIMGCMFAFMVIAPNYIVYDLPVIGDVKNIYGCLVYILIMVVYQRKKKEEKVNHEFHFYGAAAGLLMGLLLNIRA